MISDCRDSGCLFAVNNKTGQRTNGGCRCVDFQSKTGLRIKLRAVADERRQLFKAIAAWKGALESYEGPGEIVSQSKAMREADQKLLETYKALTGGN